MKLDYVVSFEEERECESAEMFLRSHKIFHRFTVVEGKDLINLYVDAGWAPFMRKELTLEGQPGFIVDDVPESIEEEMDYLDEYAQFADHMIANYAAGRIQPTRFYNNKLAHFYIAFYIFQGLILAAIILLFFILDF